MAGLEACGVDAVSAGQTFRVVALLMGHTRQSLSVASAMVKPCRH